MKKIRNKIIVISLLLVFIIFAGAYTYLSDYYKAEPAVIELMNDDKNVSIADEGNMITFKPKNSSSGIGFVFYPGGKVEHLAYIPLMQKIAERGYTCVLMKMPFNLAVFDIDAASRAFKEITEVDFWYVGGHSLGGAMSSEFAQKNPEKIKGIILLGAYTSGDLSNSDLKLLSIYGSEDKILNLEALEESKIKEPKNSSIQIIEGGNHAYFGNYKEQKGDGIAYITNDEQQNITADIIAEFLEATLE